MHLVIYDLFKPSELIILLTEDAPTCIPAPNILLLNKMFVKYPLVHCHYNYIKNSMLNKTQGYNNINPTTKGNIYNQQTSIS